MSNKGAIVAAMVVFVVLVTFPFWFMLSPAGEGSPPELALPQDGSRCVEDKEWMTANHMDLLDEWRDAVVREGRKDYVSKAGNVYEMSLTKTCMGCHTDRDAFCTKCHDYENVEPRCWDCHLELQGN
jgi:hypothetical protein